MADLVVGMAKSVVDGALTKAQAAIDEQARLRRSAKRNLVFITGEFQMMQSFLRGADGERLASNALAWTLAQQIRDLAYDVEDCIEFVVHLDKRDRWWLRLLEPGRWFMPCLAPLQLDEAVDELNRLKARVEDVSSRSTRYSLIGGDHNPAAAAAAEQQQPAASSAFDRLISAAGSQKGNLTPLLLVTKNDGSGEDLRVISVWGSGDGDLGIKSVVWNAYIDKETRESFPCRAWVKLGCPLNPHELVRSLTAQFFATTCQDQAAGQVNPIGALKKMVEAKQGDLLDEFAQHMKDKRFLVVLEDLSTMEEWNSIATFLPKGGQNGSCIVVSTLHFEVASLAVGHPYRVLHLNQLPDQHSVYAFYKTDAPVASGSSCKKEAAELWKKENPLVGRESEIKHLRQFALEASAKCNHVISAWGIAGVGKSALLKYMFCDKIIRGIPFKKYAWVDLSHPFSIWDFSRSLLLSFDSQDLQTKGDDTMGSKNPILECREMLQDKRQRCLIVIDGLQSTKEWDLIQDELEVGSNPRSNSRNLIVVIASDESIAMYCHGPKEPLKYNVKGLQPEAAIRLFKQVSKKPVRDVEGLRELVSKCGGLPKVIAGIAGVIAKKSVGWMERARSINNNFIQELESNGEFRGLQDLFRWMRSYFRKCPDSLKPCIFYLSIFSPDQLIRRRRLVRRWVAEGYSRDSHDESAEENGEKQFSDLLSLSIIQQPSSFGLGDTRMVSCQVNGFFREYIVEQGMEDNLVFELDGSCAVTSQRTGRHLAISKGWDRNRIVFNSTDFSRLRSLTVSGRWEPFFISESMKLLRVLDLEDVEDKDPDGVIKCSDIKNIVKWFPRLKFLSLRGRTTIYFLPRSIGDLRQLQTLDVRDTSVVTLPVGITKLENLQYIRAGTSRGHQMHLAGTVMPPGIGKLTALQTLGVVDVSTTSGTKAAIFEDLKELTQLRKLGVSGINKDNSASFFDAISALVHLESLSVRLTKDNGDCLQGTALPLESLRSLKLHGLGDKLPEKWRTQLTKLTKIDLEMTTLVQQAEENNTTDEDVMLFLDRLPELCILRLRVMRFQGGQLCVKVIKNALEDDSYKKLKILEIACSSGAQVTFGSKAMKKLEHLKVDCGCNGSDYKFEGLEHLSDLKEVCLKGPNQEKKSGDLDLKEDLERQLKRLSDLKEDLETQLNGNQEKISKEQEKRTVVNVKVV